MNTDKILEELWDFEMTVTNPKNTYELIQVVEITKVMEILEKYLTN